GGRGARSRGRTESSPRSRAQYEGRGRGEDRKRCIVQGCGLRQPNPSNDATQDYPEFRPEAPWFCLRFFPASSPAHTLLDRCSHSAPRVQSASLFRLWTQAFRVRPARRAALPIRAALGNRGLLRLSAPTVQLPTMRGQGRAVAVEQRQVADDDYLRVVLGVVGQGAELDRDGASLPHELGYRLCCGAARRRVGQSPPKPRRNHRNRRRRAVLEEGAQVPHPGLSAGPGSPKTALDWTRSDRPDVLHVLRLARCGARRETSVRSQRHVEGVRRHRGSPCQPSGSRSRPVPRSKLCNDAIDQVRRAEARKLREAGDNVTLKHTRWVLVKRRANLTGKQRSRLRELLRVNLTTVKAYLLKDDLSMFWKYKSPTWAGRFLDGWIV